MVHVNCEKLLLEKINVTILETWGCGDSYIIDDCWMTLQQQDDKGGEWLIQSNELHKQSSTSNSQGKLKQNVMIIIHISVSDFYPTIAADKILRHNIWDNSIAVDINMLQIAMLYTASHYCSLWVACKMEIGHVWFRRWCVQKGFRKM